MNLEGKTAIVTGASRGIGKAIALAMGEKGANVVVNYVNTRDAAKEVVQLIKKHGQEAITVRADVRNLDEVKQMVMLGKDKFGSIDILVNNAGIIRDNFITFMKDEEWTEVLDIDLKGAFHCIKTAGREMARQKYGRIINISSDAGLLGDLMRANYASAKAGLIGLTKTAAREFAASGINVNAVTPGIINTDLISGMSESRRKNHMERIPLARFGKPEEVAQVVVFLASDDARYITGQVICVDGGLYM